MEILFHQQLFIKNQTRIGLKIYTVKLYPLKMPSELNVEDIVPSKSCSENLWIISHGTHLVYTMSTMKLEPFVFDGPLTMDQN